MRAIPIFLAAALLLAVSGCAVVQTGVVWDADSWDRTVTIGDTTYEVTSETGLWGPDGESIVFDQIPRVAGGGIGLRSLGRAEVDFRARDRAGTPQLLSLWVRRP